MSQTYSNILQEMLDKVPSNVDTREGSIIYDALAPCAYFLAQQQFLLDNYMELVFADTAVDEYLDRVAADHGMSRKAATAAVRQVATSGPVTIGTIWGISGLKYTITEMISENLYKAECSTVGTTGNQYSGILSPVSDVTGITATLGEILKAGTDEETDDALRERFFEKVQSPATSGNTYQYHQWALGVEGVGAAKVFPLDNGAGTVTVLVVDSNKAVDESLPDTVAAYIETVRPIGATVTVTSPEEKSINVSATVTLDGTKSLKEVTDAFEAELETLLAGTVFTMYSVSYAKIGSLLLEISGVEDYTGLLVDSGNGNVKIGDKEIPIKGTVVLTEAG